MNQSLHNGIKIQLNPIKIILIYCPSFTSFIYAITFNIVFIIQQACVRRNSITVSQRWGYIINHFINLAITSVIVPNQLKSARVKSLLKTQRNRCWFVWLMVFNATQCSQQYFGYIVAVRSIGEGNMSTRRKPQTCRKSLTNFITNCCLEYMLPWMGFEYTTSVVIDTDCTDNCTSNYHMITTMMAPVI